MKIKLQANSINSVNMLKQANFDVDYGYSLTAETNGDANPENSWAVKLAGKLEKMFSFKKDKIEDNITQYVSQTANFLNQHLDTPEFLDGMKIQMNVDSFINSAVKESVPLVAQFSIPLASKMHMSTDKNAGHIYTNQKKIFIGTDLFTEDKKLPFIQVLKEKIGLEKTVSFVVLHEASHSFQHSNNEILGVEQAPVFSDLITSCMNISNYGHRSFTFLNHKISEHEGGFLTLNFVFIEEIKSLNAEIYADTGALLLERNKSFIQNSYKKEESLEMIDALIEARKKEHLQDRETSSVSQYVSTFNHFTSPGIEYLKDNYDSLPQRVMTQAEIHSQCNKCIQQGISRVLISSLNSNNENVGQLKTLFHLQNENGILFIPKENESDIYLKSITQLKTLAGSKWMEQFNEKIKTINGKDLFHSNIAKWHAGVNQEEFQKDLTKNPGITKNIGEVFEISEDMKQRLKTPQTLNDIIGFPENNKSLALQSMQKIREAASSGSKNNLKNNLSTPKP